MAKWNVSPQFNNTTAWYVTFTSNAALSGYKIYSYLYGRNGPTANLTAIAFPNVINDDGTTATIFCGSPSNSGDWISFPEGGFVIKPNVNVFVTLTWAAASTGTLAVLFDAVPK